MFRTYYPQLCGFAAGYVKSKDAGREVVQNVFLKIWERRGRLQVHTSFKSYLYRAVRNQALDRLKKARRRAEFIGEMQVDRMPRNGRTERRTAADEMRHKELTDAIWRAVDELPERRKTTFILHRQHDLTYAEIAEVMGVTRKTVENQMGRALKTLRQLLASEYL